MCSIDQKSPDFSVLVFFIVLRQPSLPQAQALWVRCAQALRPRGSQSLFIQTIAEESVYYIDNEHNNICCVLNQAIGNVSGSAIPAHYPMPTYPLDALFVADVINNPHVFTEDYSIISAKIDNRIFIPVIPSK